MKKTRKESDKNKEMIMHDMRSKLSVIMLYLDLLARDDEKKTIKDRQNIVAIMKNAAEGMRVSLNQLK